MLEACGHVLWGVRWRGWAGTCSLRVNGLARWGELCRVGWCIQAAFLQEKIGQVRTFQGWSEE